MPWLAPTRTNDYNLIKQISDAAVYRGQVIGRFFGLDTSNIWFAGNVPVPGTVTETGFTTAQTWRGGAGSGDPPYADPWNGNEVSPLAPSVWMLVFDHCNPDKVIKTIITGWTNAGGLTYQNIRDHVTSKKIPSIASLAGRKWYIIRGDRGKWVDDLVYERPNARPAANGVIAVYHDDPANPLTITSPTTTKITDRKNRWPKERVIGLDLLVYATDGFLKRVTITGYADDSFIFPMQTWTAAVGSEYCVVKAGGYGVPGRKTKSPWIVYRGLRESKAAVFLNDYTADGYQPIGKMQGFLEQPKFADGACTTEQVRVSDAFFKTENFPSDDDLACGVIPDKFYTPDLFKTIRGLQDLVDGLGPFFIEKKNYHGDIALNQLVPAALHKLIGLPSVTITGYTVTGGAGNSIDFAAPVGPLPYDPIKCHWALRRPRLGNYKWGLGRMTINGLTAHQSGEFANFDNDDDEADVSLIISFGWRGFPRDEVAQIYPKSGWIADTIVDPITFELHAIDPPLLDYSTSGCLGAGKWFRRLPSTNLLRARDEDPAWMGDEGLMLENGKPIVDGMLCRYAGHNRENPNALGFDRRPLAGDDPQGKYFGYMAVTHGKPHKRFLRGNALRGRAAKGSTPKMILNPKTDLWLGEGVLRTEEGVATAGSTTSLTDNTKTAEPAQCFWKASRFVGFASPWQYFVGEVRMSGASWDDPAAVIEKFLVDTGNEATGQLTWVDALSATAAAKPWRIREPRYELNGFEQRKIEVWQLDPVTGFESARETRTIVAHDDKAIFLDTALPFTPDENTLYQIVEITIGHVIKRVAGNWVIATGADASRIGNEAQGVKDFTPCPSYNLPGYRTEYGKHTLRDAICGDIFIQLQTAIDALQTVAKPAEWMARDFTDPTTPVMNGIGAGANDSTGDLDETDTVSYIPTGHGPTVAEAHYDHAPCPASSLAEVGGPPQALYEWHRSYHQSTDPLNGNGEYSNDTSHIAIDAHWSRLIAILPETRGCGMDAVASIDYYVWPQIDSVDTAEGTTVVVGGDYQEWHFEAGPDPFIYHHLSLVANTPAADAVAGGTYQSPRIGGGGGPTPIHPGRPPAPPDPPPWDPDVETHTYFTYGGMYLDDKWAVVNYNFPIPPVGGY